MGTFEVATHLKPLGVVIEGIQCTVGMGGTLHIQTEDFEPVAVYASGAWLHYRWIDDEDTDE